MKYKDFILTSKPHGPALTLKYNKPGEHHIDIDLSPCLHDKSIKVNPEVWERPFIKTERGKKLVDPLKETPTLLVPKSENAWLVSHEKVMKETFNKMDTEGTARKECHRILKYDIMKWSSQKPFPGMSTCQLKVIFSRNCYIIFSVCLW